MSLYKMDKSLKELHQKLEEEQKLREMPGLVAGIEDALCSCIEEISCVNRTCKLFKGEFWI